MIIIMTEEEYEELKPNRILLESNVNVVIRKKHVEIVKNTYRFINGAYTVNDFVNFLRKIINLMKRG